MKIISLKALPPLSRNFFDIVKTILAKTARKDGTKSDVASEFSTYLGAERSALIVTKHGLAVFDVNPQGKTEIKNPTSPAAKAYLDAQQAVKDANAKLSIAYNIAKEAGDIIVAKAPPTPRLEILNEDKTAEMNDKYATQIRQIRKGEAQEITVATA